MLEDGATLWTWALDSPPAPGCELPARRLPNHRLAYLSYEGSISGDRGAVRRVAEGTYSPIVWEATRLIVDLKGDQLVGRLVLSMDAPSDGPGSPGGFDWKLRLGKVD
nr:hypothetical protein [Aquisphaera insulae]